jgi:hypothetical protein
MLGRRSSWNARTQVRRGARMGGNPSTCFVPVSKSSGPRLSHVASSTPKACGVAGLRVRRRGFGRKAERRRDERGSLQHTAPLGLRKGEKWRARKRTRVWQRMKGNPLRRARIWPTGTVPVRRKTICCRSRRAKPRSRSNAARGSVTAKAQRSPRHVRVPG